MKKKVSLMLCLTVLCGLFLAAQAGTANAAKAGFGFTIATGAEITVDGKWTTTGEWVDSYKDFLYSGLTMTASPFRCKWGSAPSEGWLVEVVTDTTSDAGDYFQMSVDTLQDGGTAPQSDDFLINVTGHTPAGIRVYKGTGTGWTDFAVGADVVVSTTIDTSPTSATAHWIIEIYLAKLGVLAMQFNNNMRMAAFDASNPSVTLMWPTESSANVPNDYGTGTTSFEGSIPEGLTIGVMALLSSVGVLAGARYFRKKPKT